MVSDYVMTEKNCRRKEVVPDSVGMGAYNMDSHHVQRYVTPRGFVRNEGDVQVGTRPYPISYRSIRPRAGECTNLLVPVCLSATHVGWGAIRLEPVWMQLGEVAGVATALASKQKIVSTSRVLPWVYARPLATTTDEKPMPILVFHKTLGPSAGQVVVQPVSFEMPL